MWCLPVIITKSEPEQNHSLTQKIKAGYLNEQGVLGHFSMCFLFITFSQALIKAEVLLFSSPYLVWKPSCISDMPAYTEGGQSYIYMAVLLPMQVIPLFVLRVTEHMRVPAWLHLLPCVHQHVGMKGVFHAGTSTAQARLGLRISYQMLSL